MLTVSDNHIVLGGGGGGSTTFAGLSDKATADIPTINTPLATALSAKEATSNKKTDVDANKTSDTFFPTVKAVFDWVSGLFVKGAASSTDNAIARFDGTTGKVVKNSGVTISDNGSITSNGILNITTNGDKASFYENDVPTTDAYFKVANATNTSGTYIPLFTLKGNGATSLYANGFVFDAKSDIAGGGGVCEFMARANGAKVVNRPLFVFSNSFSGYGGACMTINANKSVRFYGQIVDNSGNEGADGQVLKKVGGLVLWSNP